LHSATIVVSPRATPFKTSVAPLVLTERFTTVTMPGASDLNVVLRTHGSAPPWKVTRARSSRPTPIDIQPLPSLVVLDDGKDFARFAGTQ